MIEVYKECVCPYCNSIMFPYAFEPSLSSLWFMCPRRCSFKGIFNIHKKINTSKVEFLLNTLIPPQKSHYKNSCWNCSGIIDSRDPHIKKFYIPSLGFICLHCGESLEGYFKMKGLITSHFITVPKEPIRLPDE
jgi:hypothetical protein